MVDRASHLESASSLALFRDLRLGDTFLDVDKYIKISDNQAMTCDFNIFRYYGDDEVEKVTNPNECLYLIEGSNT